MITGLYFWALELGSKSFLVCRGLFFRFEVVGLRGELFWFLNGDLI